jgi:hypothetical protein
VSRIAAALQRDAHRAEQRDKRNTWVTFSASHLSIVSWFLRRWQVEVTFQEVRTHLGVETQRQWSNLAIARATPCLLALFSLVTLFADRLVCQGTVPLSRDAWHAKQRPTFADALAAVRQQYWTHMGFRVSGRKRHILQSTKALRDRLVYALCRAALRPKSS